MKVVLATVGTRGDVQPMAALAQALRRRGHEAKVACPESFGPWLRSLAIEHCTLGEDLSALMAAGGSKLQRSLAGMQRYFTEQLLLQAPGLLEIAGDAQAIVGTAMAWSAPSVAEKLGIPALELFPSACLPSRLHPPPLMPWYGLPGWLNALLWRLNDALQNRLMGKPLNLARERIGLQPLAAFVDHLFVDTPAVLAVDPEVFPPDPAWQERYPYAGFLFLDDPTPLDPELAKWLEADEPPVCIGFGSMAGEKPDRVANMLRDVMQRIDRRCLILSGASTAFEQIAPADRLRVVREAPHLRLLPKVAAFVHHGGSGTTAAALHAGVPQVVLPMMLDQFHHAHHLARAGLAPVSPSMSRASAEALAAAIQQALAMPVELRRSTSERLRRSDAGAQIVARLERMASAS